MASLQYIYIEIELRTSTGTKTIWGNCTNPKEAADYLRKLADAMEKLHAEISRGDAGQNR